MSSDMIFHSFIFSFFQIFEIVVRTDKVATFRYYIGVKIIKPKIKNKLKKTVKGQTEM